MADSNDRLPSTTFEWRKVKIRRPAGGRSRVPRKGVRWRRFPTRDEHQWLTIRVRYSGGPEAWCIVDARGEVNALPGWLALVDLILMINQASPERLA